MADQFTRELERAWKESGSSQLAREFLQQEIRNGRVTRLPGRKDDEPCPQCGCLITIEDVLAKRRRKDLPRESPVAVPGVIGVPEDRILRVGVPGDPVTIGRPAAGFAATATVGSVAIGVRSCAKGPYAVAAGYGACAETHGLAIGFQTYAREGEVRIGHMLLATCVLCGTIYNPRAVHMALEALCGMGETGGEEEHEADEPT